MSKTKRATAMSVGELAVTTSDLVGRVRARDGLLVEACRRGDPEAFAQLVALHEGLVFNLAGRLLGDVEEARDVAQEVFLQVYRSLDRFEGRSSLRTWIYRIVVNRCRNRQRWWRRRSLGHSRPLETLSPAEEARLSLETSPWGGPHERLERRELTRRLDRALAALRFEQRVVLLLRELEGLSIDEIARTLELPAGTVKSRLARGRDALRLALERPAEAGA